ncbi:LPXTG cell wall anchor domain-containing protein [Limosilactobacillus vaginalis]|nr:LPXTG cell wall anchor domain-containing protein [Limosilactobacillus vaginalis]
MKTLPQTGNNNGEAVAATGLGLTSLASMFGFGLLKRRFN